MAERMCGMTGTALVLLAIKPKTKADRERLRLGLGTLLAEDPTIRMKTDQGTGEVVIGGMGELHLEVIIDLSLPETQSAP